MLTELFKTIENLDRKSQIALANHCGIKLRRLKRMVRDTGQNATLQELVEIAHAFDKRIDVSFRDTGMIEGAGEIEQ